MIADNYIVIGGAAAGVIVGAVAIWLLARRHSARDD